MIKKFRWLTTKHGEVRHAFPIGNFHTAKCGQKNTVMTAHSSALPVCLKCQRVISRESNIANRQYVLPIDKHTYTNSTTTETYP